MVSRYTGRGAILVESDCCWAVGGGFGPFFDEEEPRAHLSPGEGTHGLDTGVSFCPWLASLSACSFPNIPVSGGVHCPLTLHASCYSAIIPSTYSLKSCLIQHCPPASARSAVWLSTQMYSNDGCVAWLCMIFILSLIAWTSASLMSA